MKNKKQPSLSPVNLLTWALTHPGKALVSVLALQELSLQGTLASDWEPSYDHDGVGFTYTNGESETSVHYRPRLDRDLFPSDRHTAKHTFFASDKTKVEISGSVNSDFNPDSSHFSLEVTHTLGD